MDKSKHTGIIIERPPRMRFIVPTPTVITTVYLYTSREKILKNAQNLLWKQQNSKILSNLKSLQFLLPPRHREEFAGDITEIYNTLKEDGKSKIWIYLILLLNVTNVFWGGFLFKYNEYFGKEKGKTEVNTD